jgi:hypothetical protein
MTTRVNLSGIDGNTGTLAESLTINAISHSTDISITSNSHVGLFVESANGNVGIGTSTPTNQFVVKTADGAGIAVENSSGNQYRWAVNSDDSFSLVDTGTAERMRIDSVGRIMIAETSNSGYSNNADDLIVGDNGSSTERGISLGSTLAASIRFNDGADAGTIDYTHSTNSMRFITNSSVVAMTIDSSGNLLVGHTSQYSPIQNGGSGITLNANGQLFVGGQFPSYFNREDSDGDIAVFRKDGGAVGSIGTSSGFLYAGHDDVGLIFRSNESIRPYDPSTTSERHAQIDLGHDVVRFKNLFLSDRLYASSITGPNIASSFSTASGHASSPFIFYSGQFGVDATERMRISPGNIKTSSVSQIAMQPTNVTGLTFEYQLALPYGTTNGDATHYWLIAPTSQRNVRAIGRFYGIRTTGVGAVGAGIIDLMYFTKASDADYYGSIESTGLMGNYGFSKIDLVTLTYNSTSYVAIRMEPSSAWNTDYDSFVFQGILANTNGNIINSVDHTITSVAAFSPTNGDSVKQFMNTKVGIGTTNPGKSLEVAASGGTPGIRLRRTDITNSDVDLLTGGGSTGKDFLVRVNQQERLRIDSNGNIESKANRAQLTDKGVGTASDTYTVLSCTNDYATNESGVWKDVCYIGHSPNFFIHGRTSQNDTDSNGGSARIMIIQGFYGSVNVSNLANSTYSPGSGTVTNLEYRYLNGGAPAGNYRLQVRVTFNSTSLPIRAHTIITGHGHAQISEDN